MKLDFNMSVKDFDILFDYCLDKYQFFQFTSLVGHRYFSDIEWENAYLKLCERINTATAIYKNPNKEFINELRKWDFFADKNDESILEYCKLIIKQDEVILSEIQKNKNEFKRDFNTYLKTHDIADNKEITNILENATTELSFFNEVTTSGALMFNYLFVMNESNTKWLDEKIKNNGTITISNFRLEDFAVFDSSKKMKIAFCTHEFFINNSFDEEEIKELKSLGFTGFICE